MLDVFTSDMYTSISAVLQREKFDLSNVDCVHPRREEFNNMTFSGSSLEDAEDSSNESRQPQNSMTNDPRRVWPNEILPYQFDVSVGKLLVCYKPSEFS